MVVPTLLLEAASIACFVSSRAADLIALSGGASRSGLGVSGCAGSCDSTSALELGFDGFREPMWPTGLYMRRLMILAMPFGIGRPLITTRDRGFSCQICSRTINQGPDYLARCSCYTSAVNYCMNETSAFDMCVENYSFRQSRYKKPTEKMGIQKKVNLSTLRLYKVVSLTG